jgi:hypothetical protein
MAVSDTATTADQLREAIDDVMNYDFEVVDISEESHELEASCLSCS